MAHRFLVTLVAACALAVAPATAQANGAWSLEAAQAAACTRQHSSVYVSLSAAKYPQTTDHIQDAIAAGHAALLHIDRADEDLHRSQSLAPYPPRSGYDRDEYPPAMSREGGTGADVRYISPSDNRGAGSVMGNALEPYCEDQPFRFRITA
jgi:hypothetical protein